MNNKSLTTQSHQREEINSRVPPEYWPNYKTVFLVSTFFKVVVGGHFTFEDLLFVIKTADVFFLWIMELSMHLHSKLHWVHLLWCCWESEIEIIPRHISASIDQHPSWPVSKWKYVHCTFCTYVHFETNKNKRLFHKTHFDYPLVIKRVLCNKQNFWPIQET